MRIYDEKDRRSLRKSFIQMISNYSNISKDDKSQILDLVLAMNTGLGVLPDSMFGGYSDEEKMMFVDREVINTYFEFWNNGSRDFPTIEEVYSEIVHAKFLEDLIEFVRADYDNEGEVFGHIGVTSTRKEDVIAEICGVILLEMMHGRMVKGSIVKSPIKSSAAIMDILVRNRLPFIFDSFYNAGIDSFVLEYNPRQRALFPDVLIDTIMEYGAHHRILDSFYALPFIMHKSDRLGEYTDEDVDNIIQDAKENPFLMHLHLRQGGKRNGNSKLLEEVERYGVIQY